MPRDRGRLGCAAESADRGESLRATASRVRRWMLVEQPGPWGREALTESRLERDVALTVRSHARRAGVRVVLIRRPGWHSTGRRRVYLVRSDRVHRWIEQLDIEDSRQLMRVDLTMLDGDEPPGMGATGPAGVHLVCTNGRHDPCCADLGRPVTRALREAGVAEVWESSHIGGDRFAANLVCLPTGVYYGRVPPADGPRIVREHALGMLDLDCYRGRSCYPPMMQAAEIFARHELGERRLDALRFTSMTRDGHDAATVVLAHDGKEAVTVRVARRRGVAEHMTCDDHGTTQPWQYRLIGLSRSDRQ